MLYNKACVRMYFASYGWGSFQFVRPLLLKPICFVKSDSCKDIGLREVLVRADNLNSHTPNIYDGKGQKVHV